MARAADTIENIVTTTLATIYSIAWSFGQLIRSPFRAPMRLLVRKRSSVISQVGPYTLLFVAVNAVFFAAGRSDSQFPLLRDIVLSLKTPAELLVAAFVTVMAVDVALRIVATRLPRDRRRQRFILTTLYSASAQAAYLILFLIIASLWAGYS